MCLGGLNCSMKNRFLNIVNKEYFCNKINLAGSEKPNSKQSRKLNMNDYEKVVNKLFNRDFINKRRFLKSLR